MERPMPMGLRFSLLHRAFLRRLDARLQEKGLTGVQFGVLGQLERLRCEGRAEVNQRDLESQVREWRAHNFFYKIHVFRSRTKDVDLELKQSWPRELFCRIVSFFYFWD